MLVLSTKVEAVKWNRGVLKVVDGLSTTYKTTSIDTKKLIDDGLLSIIVDDDFNKIYWASIKFIDFPKYIDESCFMSAELVKWYKELAFEADFIFVTEVYDDLPF